MLKGQSGSMATGLARVPGAHSQTAPSSGPVPASSSRRTMGQPGGQGTFCAATDSSMKVRRAPASRAMAASCAGVAPVASGATAAPARSAPTNATT